MPWNGSAWWGSRARSRATTPPPSPPSRPTAEGGGRRHSSPRSPTAPRPDRERRRPDRDRRGGGGRVGVGGQPVAPGAGRATGQEASTEAIHVNDQAQGRTP